MIYQIRKNGDVYQYDITPEIINKYIQEQYQELGSEYDIIENACKREAELYTTPRTVYVGSTMKVPLSYMNSTKLGKIKNYSYYEDIEFDESLNIIPLFQVRLNYDKKFSYVVQNSYEKLPDFIYKMVKYIVGY